MCPVSPPLWEIFSFFSLQESYEAMAVGNKLVGQKEETEEGKKSFTVFSLLKGPASSQSIQKKNTMLRIHIPWQQVSKRF